MTITVAEQGGVYRLMVADMFKAVAAGPRLQRGTPLPIDDFTFFDEIEATEAANKLQAYVNTNVTVKGKKRK